MAKPKKILVVDDSRTFVTYISLLLRKMGFTKIVLAENGVEALKILKLWNPDAIILDINMPEMDGIATLKSLKRSQATASIPVVMVTSTSTKKKYKQCEELGCAAYLTKPIKISTLHDVLQDCVNRTGGARRWHLRAPYRKKVQLKHKRTTTEYEASTLSEGGVFLKTDAPLPVGTNVQLTLPIKDETPLAVKGKVIYLKLPEKKRSPYPPGMAIKFQRVSEETTELLRVYVTELIVG